METGGGMEQKTEVSQHILVEDRSLDSVCNFIRPSHHIKYTSVAASHKLLFLGTSTGMILVFQRDESLKQRYLIRVASATSACAVSLLRVSCDERHIAASTSDGGISIIELYSRLKAKPSVTAALADKPSAKITDVTWNNTGNVLYAGDEEGRVYAYNNSAVIFSGMEELVQVDSSVVQLDCIGETLLISTMTRSYLVNTSSKTKTVIGKQPRNGYYGACFLRLPGVDTPSIYCGRRRGRLWEADFTGNVLNTHELQDSATRMPAATIFGVGMDFVDPPAANGRSPPLEYIVAPEPASASAGLSLGRLLSFGSRFILSYSGSQLCVADPITVNVVLWSDCLKGVVDICCVKEDLYVISSGGEEVHEIHFTTAASYLEKSLLLQQALAGTLDKNDTDVAHATVCCHICLALPAVVQDMLSTGQLSPAFLKALRQVLAQLSSEESQPVVHSLASKLCSIYGQWIDLEDPDLSAGHTYDISPGVQPTSLDLTSETSSDDVTSQQNGQEDVNGHLDFSDDIGIPVKLSTLWSAPSCINVSHEDSSDNGDTESIVSATSVGETSASSRELTAGASVTSVSRSGRPEASPQGGAGAADGQRSRRSSTVSCSGSELSLDATTDTALVEAAPAALAKPMKIPSARKQFANFISSAGSPKGTLLQAKDSISAKITSFVDFVRTRPKSLVESSRQDMTAETADTAQYEDSEPCAATDASASSGAWEALLLQTGAVQAALRAACGLDAGGSRRELSEQLRTWVARLWNARAAVVEHTQAPSLQWSGHSDLGAWKTQPVRVSSLWLLTSEKRDVLVSTAMLSIELGCVAAWDEFSAATVHSPSVDTRAAEDCQCAGSVTPGTVNLEGRDSVSDIGNRTSDEEQFVVAAVCSFMRQFFFLMDVRRLAAWIARSRHGLEYWRCFVECLEEMDKQFDHGTTILQTSFGSDTVSADEVLQRTLMLAKPHLLASNSSTVSGGVAVRVFLSASRFIALYTEKVVAFCSEVRQFVHPAHVKYMLQMYNVDFHHFVTYMDRVLQGLTNSGQRSAFIREQCSTAAVGHHWLQCVLSSDRAKLSGSVHCECCGMIRPLSHSMTWAHAVLLDEMVSEFMSSIPHGAFEQPAVNTKEQNSPDAVISMLMCAGYWNGCLTFWKGRQQRDAVLKCLLQNGDLSWFDNETELLGLSCDEWTRVLQLRRIQEPTSRSESFAADCLVRASHCGAADDYTTAGTQQIPTPFGSFCLPGTSVQSNVASCIYCGQQIESAQVIAWDHLLLLFANRHGLSRLWSLVQQAALPLYVFDLSFYASCFSMAEKEVRQKKSIEKIMETMNSYLWSRRPTYASPALRYLITHTEDHAHGSEQGRSVTAAMHRMKVLPQATQMLLDDAACHWGTLIGKSSKCQLCACDVLSSPSRSSDSSVVIFDCAHAYHRHCLLDERICPACALTRASTRAPPAR